MSLLSRVRAPLRWILGLGLVAAGFWTLKLALLHGWVAGGPPTDYPEWHAHWAAVLLALAAALFLLGGLLIWLLRPRGDRATMPPDGPLHEIALDGFDRIN